MGGQFGALKVARCSDPACAGRTLSTHDFGSGDTSIAIGTDDGTNPVVSYRGPGNELKVTRAISG